MKLLLWLKMFGKDVIYSRYSIEFILSEFSRLHEVNVGQRYEVTSVDRITGKVTFKIPE